MRIGAALLAVMMVALVGCPGQLGKEGSKRSESTRQTTPTPTPTETARPDDEQLLGTWRDVQVIADGDDRTADAVRDQSQVTFRKNGKLTVRVRGDQWEDNYRLAGPGQIDMGLKGQYLLGIYKLEGDRLTICVSMVPDKRAADFTSAKGSGQILEVMERVRDDKGTAETIGKGK